MEIRCAFTDIPLNIINNRIALPQALDSEILRFPAKFRFRLYRLEGRQAERERSMTSKQRAYLKSLASSRNSIFQVGKSSLTPELTQAVAQAFNRNELIKVSVLKNCLDDPREIAEMLAERTHSQVVQVIGKKIVLYKPDRENPVIVLPD